MPEMCIRDSHMAVLKGDDLVGHADAPRGRAGLAFFGNFGGRQVPARPGVDDLPVAAVRCTGRMQLAAAAKAGVDQPPAGQLVEIRCV